MRVAVLLFVAVALPMAGRAQEIVTGPIQVAETPESRQAALDLLTRARRHYALRTGAAAYDLKVSFTTDSGGATRYDGSWHMEEIFDPHQGLRWTAEAAAGYNTARVAANRHFYAEGTAGSMPLRLQDARAALFGPIATPQYADRDLIRTSQATFRGLAVTCVLLSGAENPAAPSAGRRANESEECIDPQSGLLQLHSLAPGQYLAYDYTNPATLGAFTLPRRVVETEGGRTVMTLQVDSLTALASPDAKLFAPSEAMAANDPGVAVAEARKIFVFAQKPSPGAVFHAVCVFGLLTPQGTMEEAHSLQPADPDSVAAVKIARRLRFEQTPALGARPEQRFVYVFVRFPSRPGRQP